MSNMSYCRFENTLRDLEDCIVAMNNASTLADLDMSKYEERAFNAMWNTCREFLAEHARLITAETV